MVVPVAPVVAVVGVPAVPVPAVPEVVLLVVPDGVPLVVSDGTLPGSAGTVPGSEGTVPESDGTLPGKAGTAGTVGPAALAVPAVEVVGCVTTVVTPSAVAGGMTTVPVRPAGAPTGAGVVVFVFVPGVVVLGGGLVPPTPVTTRGGAPSGSTQFTSRFEQKSGIVVRSVESAA